MPNSVETVPIFFQQNFVLAVEIADVVDNF